MWAGLMKFYSRFSQIDTKNILLLATGWLVTFVWMLQQYNNSSTRLSAYK